MKKTQAIILVFSIILIMLALTSFNSQDNNPSYATVTYSTAGKSIFIYYGEATVEEEIALKKGENINNKIVDILNNLGKKGFEVISTNTHAFNINLNKEQGIPSREGNFIEFYYTLKKIR